MFFANVMWPWRLCICPKRDVTVCAFFLFKVISFDFFGKKNWRLWFQIDVLWFHSNFWFVFRMISFEIFVGKNKNEGDFNWIIDLSIRFQSDLVNWFLRKEWKYFWGPKRDVWAFSSPPPKRHARDDLVIFYHLLTIELKLDIKRSTK